MRHYKAALVSSNRIATDMSVTINGPALILEQSQDFSIQVKWTGTPTGTLKLQCSNDVESTVTDWEDIPGSSVAIAGAAGQQVYNYVRAPFRWVRLVWTASSGSGTFTKAIFNSKGV